MRRAAAGFNRKRSIQFQGPEGKIIPVRAEVAHGPAAKVPPAVPFRPGEIDFVKRTFWSRPEEQIPIEKRRRGLRLGGPARDIHDVAIPLGRFLTLQSPGPADPDVAFPDRTDGPALDQFHHAAVVAGGMNLRPHLGGHTGLLRRLPDLPAFPDVMREWFFAIDVFLPLQRRQRGEGVGMLRSAHRHRIEALELVVEFPEIGKSLRPGKLPRGGGEILLVHIAERHDVFPRPGNLSHIPRSPAAASDDHYIQLLAGPGPDHGRSSGGGEDGGKKMTAAGRTWIHGPFCYWIPVPYLSALFSTKAPGCGAA